MENKTTGPNWTTGGAVGSDSVNSKNYADSNPERLEEDPGVCPDWTARMIDEYCDLDKKIRRLEWQAAIIDVMPWHDRIEKYPLFRPGDIQQQLKHMRKYRLCLINRLAAEGINLA